MADAAAIQAFEEMEALDRARRSRNFRRIALLITVIDVAGLVAMLLGGRPAHELLLVAGVAAVALGTMVWSRLAETAGPALVLVVVGMAAGLAAVAVTGDVQVSPLFMPVSIILAATTLHPRTFLVVASAGLCSLFFMPVAAGTPELGPVAAKLLRAAVWVSGSLAVLSWVAVASVRQSLLDLVVARREIARARAAENEAAARVALLTEHTTDLVALLTASGGTLTANRSFRRVCGLTETALAATPSRELIHPDDRPEMDHQFADALEAGTAAATYRMRTAAGTWAWMEASLSRTSIGGETLVILIARDVTRQREIAEQIHQTQQVALAARLAGGLAHDFNNLLAVVEGCAAMALTSLEPDHRARAELEDIAGAASRGSALVAQLLAVSRRAPVGPRRANVRDTLEKLQGMTSRLLGKTVTLHMDTTAAAVDVPITPSELEQVVLNLVVNARDAMPKGGTVTIHAQQDGGQLTLAVTDTGAGIPENLLVKVFEPFFTTKAAGLGTGLGLSTSQAIAASGGGTLEVTSHVGEGTTFRLRLPVLEAAGATEASTAQARPKQLKERPRVLLVDDDALVRGVLARALKAAGYDVNAVSTKADALDVVKTHGDAVNALVSDVMLETGDGFDVVASVRGLLPGTPAVLVSGYMQDPAAMDRVSGGSVVFLQKPFPMEELRRVLDGLVGRA